MIELLTDCEAEEHERCRQTQAEDFARGVHVECGCWCHWSAEEVR